MICHWKPWVVCNGFVNIVAPTAQRMSPLVVVLVARSCRSFVTPWIVACQTFLSMRFPRHEYWSGLPFSSLGDLPNPGIKSTSPALAGGFFATEPPGKPG